MQVKIAEPEYDALNITIAYEPLIAKQLLDVVIEEFSGISKQVSIHLT